MPIEYLLLLLVLGGGVWLVAMYCKLHSWFYGPQPPKRTSKRTPDSDKRPDYYKIHHVKTGQTMYWLNLRQSCALLDKRLKERKGEPTLWSE